MRKMRFLALMLSLTMLCTQMPQVAFASEIEEPQSIEVEADADSQQESALESNENNTVGENATTEDISLADEINSTDDKNLEESINGEAQVTTNYGFSVSEEGVLQFDKDSTMPSDVTAEMLAGTKTIPAKIFAKSTSLTSIEIPASVETIEAGAFLGCTNLEFVKFEDGSKLTALAAETFASCDSLSRSDNSHYLTIPASVTSIGQRCFEGCSSLYGINFENSTSLTTIEYSAFTGCTKLKDFNGLEKTKLTEITDRMFASTAVDDSVKFPSTVTTIKGYAFSGCNSLKNLNLSNLDGTKLSLEEYCFSKSNIQDVTLPNNYTVLTKGVFDGCDNLTELTLGHVNGTGVQTIKSGAIRNCKYLKTVILNKSVNTIENNAFVNCDAIKTIKIYHDEEASDTKLKMSVDSLPAHSGLTVYGYDDTVNEWVGNHSDESVKFCTLHTSMAVKINDQYYGNSLTNTGTRKNEKGVEEALANPSVVNVGDTLTVVDKAATGYTLISLTHGPESTNFVGENRQFSVSTADLDEDGKIAIDGAFVKTETLNTTSPDASFEYVDSDKASLIHIKDEDGDDAQSMVFETSSLKKQIYIKASCSGKYKTVYSNPWLWEFKSYSDTVSVNKNGVISALSSTYKTASDGTKKNTPAKITARLKSNTAVVYKLYVTVNESRNFDHIDGVTFASSSKFNTDKTEDGMALVETSVGYINTMLAKNSTGNLGVSVNAYGDDTSNYPVSSSFKWASNNTSVVKLAFEKTTSNDNTIKVCGIGQAVITATSTVDSKQKVSFIVRVVDKTPVVEDSSIFINTKAGSTIFTLIQSFGGEIGDSENAMKIVEKNTDGTWKDRTSDFELKKSGTAKDRTDGGTEQDMEISVKSTSDLYKQQASFTNLYAKLLIDDEKYYYVALPKVTITCNNPTSTIKVAGTINAFYSPASSVKNEATITLKSPDGYTVEEMPHLEAVSSTDKFADIFAVSLPSDAKSGDYSKLVIKQKSSAVSAAFSGKKVMSGYLVVKYKGYDAEKIKLDVTLTYSAPKLTIDKTKFTAHQQAQGQYFDIPIFTTVDKKKKAISLSGSEVDYTTDSSDYFLGKSPSIVKDKDGNDAIRISCTNKITGVADNKGRITVTAKVYLTNPEWNVPQTYTFSIISTNAAPVFKTTDKMIQLNIASATENYTEFKSTSDYIDNSTITFSDFAEADTKPAVKTEGEKIAVSFADGKITAQLKDATNLPNIGKNGATYTYKATYKANYSGSSTKTETYPITIKVNVVSKIPSVTLKKTTVTLNNKLANVTNSGLAAEVVEVPYTFANMPKTAADSVAFTGIKNTTNSNSKKWFDYETVEDAPIDVSFASGKMSISLGETVKSGQKFTLTGVTIDGKAAKNITITVKTVNATPSIKLTTKESINVLNSDSKATYTFTLSNYFGTINADKLAIIAEDSSAASNARYVLTSESPSHFEFVSADNGKIALKVNEDKRASLVDRKYRMKVCYSFGTDLDGNTVTSSNATLTVKPQQTLPAVTVSSANVTLYSGNTAVAASVVVKPVEKKNVYTPTVSKITWATNAGDDVKNGFISPDTEPYFDASTGKLIIKIKNAALLKRGTTYTLNYTAYFTNQLKDSKGSNFTVKVLVK